MNSFGQYFRIHTFGESHGEALGVVIDGCPAGVSWDQGLLVKNLMRRRPGQSQIVSSRNETEDVRILSGVYQGQTLGTPIALTVFNQDARSQDYVNDHGEKTFNPRSGHADDMWSAKFGHSDFRGGGRSSGRETISRVMAGSVAQMLVRQLQPETEVLSFVETIGSINLDKNELIEFGKNPNKSQFVESFHTRIPNVEKDRMATELLIKAKEQGQSYGGIARVQIVRPSKNLGQPVFK
jgi:chorismate synthase